MSDPTDDLLRLYPRPHPDSAGRILDGEAVVVTPRDSQMHTMNEVGTWLWERCDGSRSVAGIIEELIAEFEVDEAAAREDVTTFVSLLAKKGVFELQSEPS